MCKDAQFTKARVGCTQLAVTYLPAPSVVLYAQLAVSAIAAVVLHKAGLVETDALDWGKVRESPCFPKNTNTTVALDSPVAAPNCPWLEPQA